MRLIDADLAIEKCNEDLDAVKDLPQRQDGILDAIMNIHECPTIDAVPRQKYEEDMENAFAHGYTDAESNFRKMIADGELVKVVRCESCKHWKNEHICECLSRYGTFETPKDFYCGYGKEK